jgi:hypothetical protein
MSKHIILAGYELGSYVSEMDRMTIVPRSTSFSSFICNTRKDLVNVLIDSKSWCDSYSGQFLTTLVAPRVNLAPMAPRGKLGPQG